MAKLPVINRVGNSVVVECEDEALADNIEAVLRNLIQQLSVKGVMKKMARTIMRKGK